MKSSSLTIWVH